MTIDFSALASLTQALVRQQTLSGAEEPAIMTIGAEMRRLGYDEVFADENGSLIGIVNGARPGPTVLLDAHCDTVGIAPGIDWSYAAFGGEIVQDRIYGRGSADMKGALAAMVHAVGAVDRTMLAGRIAVSATVMEEVMEGIALGTVMRIVRPDYVVIGEATGLNLNHGGRGRAELLVEMVGNPAHSSSPHLGVNAVELMMDAMADIKGLELPSDPLVGQALMVLTDIISAPYPGYSVIPSRCLATYDRRLLPGETIEGVIAPLQALPSMRRGRVHIVQGVHNTYTGATLSAPKFFAAWKFDAAHEIVQKALAGLHRSGLQPKLGAYQFCTNGAYSAGIASVPTIGFGPCSEGDAHVVDEHIRLEELHMAAKGYLWIIQALLA
jgi:putative selenium metabolism hydrolase